jgi:hypothetical protein
MRYQPVIAHLIQGLVRMQIAEAVNQRLKKEKSAVAYGEEPINCFTWGKII